MVSIPILVDYYPPGYRYLYWWIINPQGINSTTGGLFAPRGIDSTSGGLLAPQGIDTSTGGLLASGYRYVFWWIINPPGYRYL